jgi:UDP-N-acetylmuramate dehydrogenase
MPALTAAVCWKRAASLSCCVGGQVAEFAISEIAFGYRHLELQPGDIVLAVELALEACDPAVVEAEVRKDFELRRTKQRSDIPVRSFFKNPKGEIVWRLIDAAGMLA